MVKLILKNIFYIYLIYLFIGYHSLFAQNQHLTDSLQKHLNTKLSDIERIDIYNALAKEYFYDTIKVIEFTSKAIELSNVVNYQKGLSYAYTNLAHYNRRLGKYPVALDYYLKAYKTNQNIGNKDLMASSLRGIGIVYKLQGNFTKALSYYQNALDLVEEIDNQKEKANIYNSMGNVLRSTGEYITAIEHYQASLVIMEKLGLKKNIASVCNNLGIVFRYLGDYPKALEYYHRSLKIRDDMGDKFAIPSTLNNLGNVYFHQEDYLQAQKFYLEALEKKKLLNNPKELISAYGNLGNLHIELKEYSKSLEYLQKALDIAEKLGHKLEMALCYNSIGDIYKLKQEHQTSIKFYLKALKISELNSDKDGMTSSLTNLGKVHYTLGNLNASEQYLIQALNKAIEINSTPKISSVNEILYQVYRDKGDYPKAFKSLYKFSNTRDSLFNKENTIKIAKLESKYAYNKKEDSLKIAQAEETSLLNSQISQQKLVQKTTLFGLSLSVLLIVVLGLFFWDKQKSNNKLKEVNEQLQLTYEEVQTQNEEIRSQNEAILEHQELIVSKNNHLQSLMSDKELLVSVVAHDLQNPVGQIQGLIEIVRESGEIPSESDRLLKMVESTSHRMKGIINHILTISSIDDTIKLNFEYVQVVSFLKDIALGFKHQSQKKKITLHISEENKKIRIKTDKIYLQQVIQNLLSNAIKYSPHNKNVYLGVFANENNYRIYVKDEGPGISPSDQKMLFIKFKKLSAKPTGDEDSTGLGLVAVKKYVDLLEGKVWVESVEGKGATFLVEFSNSNTNKVSKSSLT